MNFATIFALVHHFFKRKLTKNLKDFEEGFGNWKKCSIEFQTRKSNNSFFWATVRNCLISFNFSLSINYNYSYWKLDPTISNLCTSQIFYFSWWLVTDCGRYDFTLNQRLISFSPINILHTINWAAKAVLERQVSIFTQNRFACHTNQNGTQGT